MKMKGNERGGKQCVFYCIKWVTCRFGGFNMLVLYVVFVAGYIHPIIYQIENEYLMWTLAHLHNLVWKPFTIIAA